MTSKFDDMDWHLGGDDFPDDLPEEAAATHIGMYFTWLVERGLVGEDLVREHGAALDQVRSGQLRGSGFIVDQCDGQLLAQDLTEVGAAFTEHVYDSYLEEYGNWGDPDVNIYALPDNDETYSEVQDLLDSRFAEWDPS
ncbi:DUF7832 domain-containing protein [Parenemella sanctibonifatiensis]|uniref:DUF7832 domain-containing protein n=1 Tax=Parenemella sanctibonifatiensis TaxID=2016505 RepID=A0A255E6A9_9ACTN|nr:hypothetical protein [Parenemella sanctibonifatiensis]OYN86491.1 hypothetical protein CGZ92_09090 [Parenemella sanctibonifatiensis]